MSEYGYSGCFAPIHSRIRKSTTNSQNTNRDSGRNWLPRIRQVSSTGIARRIRSDPNIARTPKIFDGIDRRIA